MICYHVSKVVLLCSISRKMKLEDVVKETALGRWDLKVRTREELGGNHILSTQGFTGY